MSARLIALVVALLLVTGCGGGDAPTGERRLLVFAAASLTEAFEQIADAFEQQHPQVTVQLQLAGSQQLAGQILQGAPADVLATADAEQMDRVADAGLLADAPHVLARTRLALAVEPGNPLRIDGLADLAGPDVAVVLAAAQVPAGRYARQALDLAGVEVQPVSEETDVRGVLSKVALGEADAGVVYASDVATATDRVDAVPLAGDVDVEARSLIAPLATGDAGEEAAAFVAFTSSAEGLAALRAAGFSAQ